MALPGRKSLTISVAVWIHYRSVTDGRTDGHRPTASVALTHRASRGKNPGYFLQFVHFCHCYWKLCSIGIPYTYTVACFRIYDGKIWAYRRKKAKKTRSITGENNVAADVCRLLFLAVEQAVEALLNPTLLILVLDDVTDRSLRPAVYIHKSNRRLASEEPNVPKAPATYEVTDPKIEP